MEELKTLKDLKWFDASDFGVLEDNDTVLVSELKAEAVKWVDELRSIKESIMSQDYRDGKIDMLISFFNLTEEDLNGI